MGLNYKFHELITEHKNVEKFVIIWWRLQHVNMWG